MNGRNGSMIGVFFALLVVAPAGTLTLADVLAQAGDSQLVTEARVTVEAARASVDLAAVGGDLSLSLQPNVNVSTPAGDAFPGELRVTGTAGLSVPLALTRDQITALEQAQTALLTMATEIDTADQQARYELAVLYINAWLPQAEQDVLRVEYASALQREDSRASLFASGVVSAAAVDGARQDVADLEIALLENSRDVRIRWLELSYAAGLPSSSLTPDLEQPVITLLQIPQPARLEADARSANGSLTALSERIAGITSELGSADLPDIVRSVRASFSADAHSVSAAFAPASRLLSAAYSFPVYSYSATTQPSGSGSQDSWEIGFSVSLGYETDRRAQAEREKLEAELELANLELAYQQDLVSLQLRQKYQQLLLAGATVDQAIANLEGAIASRDLISAQVDSRRATAVDLAEAEARLARAEYQLTAAQVRRDQAALTVAAYTDNLGAFWLNGEEE